jgi:hypothetical protein
VVLTVLAYGERVVETLEFNELDVTVDRYRRLITFQGVLSINDEAVELPEGRFVEAATTIAEPLSGESLAEWRKRREARVWPMPPAPG